MIQLQILVSSINNHKVVLTNDIQRGYWKNQFFSIKLNPGVLALPIQDDVYILLFTILIEVNRCYTFVISFHEGIEDGFDCCFCLSIENTFWRLYLKDWKVCIQDLGLIDFPGNFSLWSIFYLYFNLLTSLVLILLCDDYITEVDDAWDEDDLWFLGGHALYLSFQAFWFLDPTHLDWQQKLIETNW